MPAPRTLILGLGNTLVSDDGVGVYAARQARTLLAARAQPVAVDVQEAEVGGFVLVELLADYDVAIIIDAIKLPGVVPGAIVELDAASLPRASHLTTGHQIDLPTALVLGRQLGQKMPSAVHIIAVQVVDDTTFGEKPSDSVAPAVAKAAERAVTLALEACRRQSSPA
jgi:hydrogenase maturation protease